MTRYSARTRRLSRAAGGDLVLTGMVAAIPRRRGQARIAREAVTLAGDTRTGRRRGIFAGTWLAARLTGARLNPELGWGDVLALAVLAGIGFTVSLLVGELAFSDPSRADQIKIYRRLWEEENRDEDADGIPDIYQRGNQGTPRRTTDDE